MKRQYRAAQKAQVLYTVHPHIYNYKNIQDTKW